MYNGRKTGVVVVGTNETYWLAVAAAWSCSLLRLEVWGQTGSCWEYHRAFLQSATQTTCCRTTHARTHAHTHTHTFNVPFSGTTQVGQYQKSKKSGFYWSKRQWVAVASAGPYASLHLAPAPHHSGVYRPDALPATQPTVSLQIYNKLLQFWGPIYKISYDLS